MRVLTSGQPECLRDSGVTWFVSWLRIGCVSCNFDNPELRRSRLRCMVHGLPRLMDTMVGTPPARGGDPRARSPGVVSPATTVTAQISRMAR